MKPDPGQRRDAARRQQQKAEKAEKKAARTAAKAVAKDATLSDDAKAARADVARLRGQSRHKAWSLLLSLDRAAALTFLEGLVRDCEGKKKTELAAILLHSGDDVHHDAAVAGHLGDVSLIDDAPHAFVDAAARFVARAGAGRAPPSSKALHTAALRFGLMSPTLLRAPVDAAVLHALPGLVTTLIDLGASRGGPPSGLVSRLSTLLLLSRPSALWMRRDVLRESAAVLDGAEASAVAHALVLAGVACGVDASVVDGEHGVTEAAVEAACEWLLQRPEKTAVMIGLGLPQLAETCAPRVRRCLWRAVFLDDGAADAARARAASGLWRSDEVAAAFTLLLRPLATGMLLPELLSACELDELEDVIAQWLSASAFRDALLSSRHVRHHAVSRALLPLVDDDPVSVGYALARSDDAHAANECQAIIERASSVVAAGVVVGVLADVETLAVIRHGFDKDRDARLRASLEHTVGGVDPVFSLTALRALIKRGEATALAADLAVARIIRRFSLATR